MPPAGEYFHPQTKQTRRQQAAAGGRIPLAACNARNWPSCRKGVTTPAIDITNPQNKDTSEMQ